jgi:secreted trypsin-like serine protease
MRLKLIFFLIIVFVKFSQSIESCGDRSQTIGLSVGGKTTVKNAWPWLTAFVHTKLNTFFCGGSLISNQHVLGGELIGFETNNTLKENFISAAHCFQSKGKSEPVLAEYVTTMLGKHDLNNFNEVGAKNSSVREIVLHPEWQWNDKVNSSYHGDVAIVVLEETVEFTRSIQPVCLPEKSSAEVVGEGTIAGWGQSNYFERHATTLKEMKIPIINAFYCLIRFPKLSYIASTTLTIRHHRRGSFVASFQVR